MILSPRRTQTTQTVDYRRSGTALTVKYVPVLPNALVLFLVSCMSSWSYLSSILEGINVNLKQPDHMESQVYSKA